MTNKKTNSIFNLTIFLIFLLINSSVANSYSVGNFVSINQIEEKEETNLPNLINLLVGALSIKQIGTVSAQEQKVCCEKTTSGAWCQNELEKNCGSEYEIFLSSCEKTVDCKTGWCFDTEEGICSKSVKKRCVDEGGGWHENYPKEKCDEGCCELPEEYQFVTKARCEYLSSIVGVSAQWDASKKEIACIFYSSDDEGACVLKEGNCKFTNEKDCVEKLEGNFHEGYLCSHPDLNTKCTKQNYVECEEGRDEIYWFDSCRNRENIYSSDKTYSWNGGLVLSKEESCSNPNDKPNINDVHCGNCGGNFESICSETKSNEKHVTDGNFICKSRNCIDEEFAKEYNGRNPKNGESWCVYEGPVGNSRDVVGSSHYKKECTDGEIKPERCDEYRGNICAERTMEGEEFTEAQCRVNSWFLCFSQKDKESCENPLLDCRMEEVNVAEGFSFSACVPKYPKGFSWTSQDAKERGEKICELGTQTCTVVYERQIDYGASKGKQWLELDWTTWKCVKNCGCKTGKFVEEMNDFCVSLGDCGGYINTEGKYSRNYGLQGSTNDRDLEKDRRYPLSSEVDVPQFISIGEEQEQGSYDGDLSVLNDKKSGEWNEKLKKDWEIAETMAHGSFGGMVVIGAVLGPVGLPLLIIGALGELLIALPISLADIGGKYTEEITFTCKPWQPPTGGNDCKKCNTDEEKPCTKYRCESFGTACRLVESFYDEENPACVNAFPNDKKPPVLNFSEADAEGYLFSEKDGLIQIKPKDKDCVQEFNTIKMTFKTNEFARCAWSYVRTTNYKQMEEKGRAFEEGNSFSQSHTMLVPVPAKKGENFEVYIRCIDFNGNFNRREYIMKACITDMPDVAPPAIKRTEPVSEGFLKYEGVTNKPLMIYINEPVECKYDSVEGKKYGDMKNNFTCNLYDLQNPKVEYSCLTGFSTATGEDFKVYIKCNDTSGNAMTKDYPYVLYATKEALKIVSIKPETGTTRKKPISEENPLILEAMTSGGAYDGKAKCSYEFVNEKMGAEFFETNDKIHRQIFTSNLPDSDYNIKLTCEDDAGNTAIGETKFTLNIDNKPPEFTRQYVKEGEDDLRIVTDEGAECRYSLDEQKKCSFDFDDGKDISTGYYPTEHIIYKWNKGTRYYIRCEDEMGNRNSVCLTIVEPEDISPPTVVRVYYDSGKLKMITDEGAECRYDLTSCSFLWGDGDKMESLPSIIHEANWLSGKIYHIRCKDKYENENTNCAIMVLPNSLV